MNKEQLISAIKNSKKYAGISEEIIGKEVESFVKANPRYIEYKEKFILKQIKEKLHKMYGSFQTHKKSKIKKMLEELRNSKDNKIIREILGANLSTKERLADYGLVYGKIFEITGKVDSVLDLGCGLNPVSYPYMELDKDAKYYAYDMNERDLDMIREFFEIYTVNSHVEAVDLRSLEEIKKLAPADMCLMFKVIDPLEKSMKGHKYAEEMIKILSNKCKFIVVSFAARTISGGKMNYPQRGWIERMLTRIGLKYESFQTSNEIFYIISKV
jgi:16S rRNA (guanine(1405)-N(7))-methyltransferase